MNIIVSPLLAIIIGLTVRSRLQAATLYLAIQAVFFTFQTLAVLLAWLGSEGGFGGATDEGAFGPSPTGLPLTFNETGFWMYGLVNLCLMLIGLAATLGIAALRGRALAKRRSVQLGTAPE